MDLLAAMQEARVEFLVIGAHALAVHGVVRASGDLDVLVRAVPDNAARVIRALEAFGAPLAAHGISVKDFCREGTVYQLGLPPRRIDVLTSISGLTFQQARQDSVLVDIGPFEIRVPSREHMLLNKRASGHPKDLENARRLEQARNGKSDD